MTGRCSGGGVCVGEMCVCVSVPGGCGGGVYVGEMCECGGVYVWGYSVLDNDHRGSGRVRRGVDGRPSVSYRNS